MTRRAGPSRIEPPQGTDGDHPQWLETTLDLP